jgi:hypothetical protein
MERTWNRRELFALVAGMTLATSGFAETLPQLVQLTPAQLWQRIEFRIENIPAAANPFDPNLIRLDAAFTLPSGRQVIVPAFWFQEYQRRLSGGSESISATGSSEWRLRFAPPETGTYSLSLTVHTNDQPCGSPIVTSFTVASNAPLPCSGYVRIASSRQYFETGDGQALRLIGKNVAWPGKRGTYDYDDWFAAMQAAGENYARLWMCPWAFGLETDANALTRFRLDHAWQLDYVLRLAEQRGIYLLLCLDYHGMFEKTPDYWGGNNYWPRNPYNVTNAGPCVNPNAFFTNTTAKTAYQKRLRYLVARYGYSPNLLAWQFLNEIDNVYAYLNPSDVAAWHGVMGGWLHANDPYHHLVTTSLTGSSDRPEIWTVPQLDFAAYHSYGEPGPATRLAAVAQSFLQRYGKPVLMDELGTDWRGWNRTNDVYLRGFRQGLWGGALGGSVGTAMSWYWENIHNENLYPIYSALGTILNRTGWGCGAWTNIDFQTAGLPPVTVGDTVSGGPPFEVFLSLSSVWAGMPTGQIAIPIPAAAGYSASTLNSFVHGVGHSDLKVPFRLSLWLTNHARLVMHLNSVSSGAIMVIRADGTELFRTNLPNLDGGYSVNNEYNLDIPVNLPAGKRLIEITNAGNDWFYLDWVRLEQVLPATYAENWQPSPDAIGLRGSRESLLYVVAPYASYPASATNTTLPLQQTQTVTWTHWPAGTFSAEWYHPATGAPAGLTRATTTNGILTLRLPDFREDLAGIVYPPPVLTSLGLNPSGTFQFRLDSETGGRYHIDKSTGWIAWSSWMLVTNIQGAAILLDSTSASTSTGFYRARKD